MTPSGTEYKVHEALRVILDDIDKHSTTLNFAVNYAKVGLNMAGHELSVQCLYIVNNIVHWRHPKAKQIRQILRDFGGDKDEKVFNRDI